MHTFLAAAARTAEHTLPEPVCTLLYILAIVATIIAFVGLLLSLVGGATRTARPGPIGGIVTNWLYAAGVALVAWLLYAFLC